MARRGAAAPPPGNGQERQAGRQAPPPSSEAREALHHKLSELGHAHLADAVENSRVEVVAADLRIATSKIYRRYFTDPAMAAAVREVFGKPLRLAVTVEEGAAPASAPLAAPPRDDETMERALANPEVQRFQEVFPGSSVYKVRNLKESM